MPNRIAPHLDLAYLRLNFWGKVDRGEDDDCWPWTKSVGSHGYGQTWDGVTVRLTHRCAWELTNGRIPEGITVDHICRNRICCNPAHLRLLTNKANASDNGFATRTHCPRGHEYTEANTYIQPSNGSRRCRACQLITAEARKARLSGATV